MAFSIYAESPIKSHGAEEMEGGGMGDFKGLLQGMLGLSMADVDNIQRIRQEDSRNARHDECKTRQTPGPINRYRGGGVQPGT